MELLQCAAVSLRQKDQTILRALSFTVSQGDIVGIAGPSGAGKSSLLRLLNLLSSPSEGRIFYKGTELARYAPTRLRREIGYVLQKPYLFEGTVRDNLEYPYLVWKEKPDAAEIVDFLERVNLGPAILDKHGRQLSGGEQQRIALVRSLLARPAVLLLDEITAALDAENTAIIERLIRDEQTARGMTVLQISHSQGQLRRMARTILSLEQGHLRFYGPAETFFAGQGAALHE